MIHTISGMRNGIGLPRRLVDGVGSEVRGGYDGSLSSADRAELEQTAGDVAAEQRLEGRSAVSSRRSPQVLPA